MLHFWSVRAFIGTGKLSKFWSAGMASWAGAAPSWAYSYFKIHTYIHIFFSVYFYIGGNLYQISSISKDSFELRNKQYKTKPSDENIEISRAKRLGQFIQTECGPVSGTVSSSLLDHCFLSAPLPASLCTL